MLTLVTGGSGSGKSAFAEDRAQKCETACRMCGASGMYVESGGK